MTVEDTIARYIADRWGEPTNAHLISNAEELQAINDDLEGHYILVADIDLDGIAWIPLGNGTRFTGTFDGNGHTISNLTLSTASNNIGLFGHVGDDEEPTVIKDTYLTGFSISGNRGVGTLIGRVTGNATTTVTNCYAEDSTVTGVTGATGGLFGSFNSYQETAGGMNNPIATNCHADVTVSASDGADKVGGLSGCGQKGKFIDCYAHGSVSCDNGERVGGFVGCLDFRGVATDCYSKGAVGTIGTGSEYGGFVGRIGAGTGNDGIVTDCYWDTETSGQPTSAGGTGKTTAQMKDPLTFIAWDDETWTLTAGEYPSLTYPTSSLYSNITQPVFVNDYDGIHGQMQTRDTIYIAETSHTNTVKGIGYHARDRSALFQLHLYGPDRKRGDAVRTKLETILDDRAVRMRYDGIDGLLFVDSRNRMEGMKRAYGHVYDIRVHYGGELI